MNREIVLAAIAAIVIMTVSVQQQANAFKPTDEAIQHMHKITAMATACAQQMKNSDSDGTVFIACLKFVNDFNTHMSALESENSDAFDKILNR